MRRGGWLPALSLLVLVRVAIPASALAHADLPGLPRIRGHELSGDATGFYAAARESVAAAGRPPRPVLVLVLAATLIGSILLIRRWRRQPELRVWLLLAAAWWIGLLLVLDVAERRFSGSAVIGWPLLWCVPMLPVRALGATIDANTAFWLGLPLQLAANAVTVVATAYAALYASGRRLAAIVAAALFAFWPFLTGLIAGHKAWQNGTWSVDAGLQMYTEPISTALVALALALLLKPRATAMTSAVAGIALGFSVAVKLSDIVVAAAALAVLLWRQRRPRDGLLPYMVGAAAFAPVVLAYWPLGYAKLRQQPGYWHSDPFSSSYVLSSWSKSSLFTPQTLAIIVPLALVGTLAVRRPQALAVLLAWTLANAIFYSFFWYTKLHPRFMWASLPSFFSLWAAGAVLLGERVISLARGELRAAPRRLSGRRAT